jgi:hypothetical protein
MKTYLLNHMPRRCFLIVVVAVTELQCILKWWATRVKKQADVF